MQGTFVGLTFLVALTLQQQVWAQAPDFSGTWHYGTLTPLQRPDDLADQTHFTAAEAAAYVADTDARFQRRAESFVGEDKFVGTDLWLDFGEAVEPDLRTSLITDPATGKIPELTEPAQARREASSAQRTTYSDPEVLGISERCLASVTPILSAPDNNYLSIVQTSDHFVMVREFTYTTRIVPLRGGLFPPRSIQQWSGASVGRWDGSVLEVVTKNFRPDHKTFGAGAGLKLVERFELIAPDRISYEFTVHDPDAFTSSWTARSTMYRSDKRRYEYACHEGNMRNMQGILKGSRILEQAGET